MAEFTVSHVSADFRCPSCDAGLTLTEWNSEYGEPIQGTHQVQCPDCNFRFVVEVETRTIYTALE